MEAMADWRLNTKQGQGSGTRLKQESLSALFAAQLAESRENDNPGRIYYHLDLNSGSGVNDISGCPGSPLTFLERANKANRRFCAYFMDSNPQSVAALRERIDREHLCGKGGAAWSYWTNNSVGIQQAIWEIDQRERELGYTPSTMIGCIFCDPNSFGSRNGVPLRQMESIARKCQRLDIVLNLNLLAFLRAETHKPKSERKSRHFNWPSVSEIVDRLKRPYWYVRNPCPTDRNRFALFVGRSRGFANTPAGFEPKGSPTWHHILSHLTRFTEAAEPTTTSILSFPSYRTEAA